MIERLCSRDSNNVLLVRFIAASLVIFSHSYSVIGGPATTEPPYPFLPFSFGTMAVCVFFALSGFLITNSFDRKAEIWRYTEARILRIFPALLCCVWISAFVIGPALTSQSLREYLFSADLWSFVWRNSTLVARSQSSLPGVFEDLPLAKAFNDPLWTLSYEIKCYGGVLVLGAVGLFRKKIHFNLLTGTGFVSLVLFVADGGSFQESEFLRLYVCFWLGAWVYVNRTMRVVNPSTLTLLALLSIFSRETPFWYPVSIVAVSVFSLWLATIQNRFLSKFNSFGDYSYGLYIYGFPIQQLTYKYGNVRDPVLLFAVSFALTLVCGVFSWHWLESRCYSLRGRLLTELRTNLPQLFWNRT